MNDRRQRVPLVALPGGRAAARVAGVDIAVVPALAEAPFPVARRVVEEDTWRVLGADPIWRAPGDESPLRLHTETAFQAPEPTGTLRVHGTRWHAVVVDLDAQPLVTPTAVRAALAAVAARVTDESVATLAVPLLGTVHGDLDWAVAMALLRDALLDPPPAPLRRLWIEVPAVRVRHTIATVGAWQVPPGG